MKLSTLALVSLAALSLPASAASITVFNLTGNPGDLALLDNTGAPLSSGFLGLYAFGAGAGSPPSSAVLAQANGDNGLLALNSYSAPGANAPDPGALFNGFNFSNPDVGGAGQFDGQNLYLMIGDGADAASSGALALINLGVSPDKSDSPPPGWVGGQLALRDNLDVVFGSVSGGVDINFANAGLGDITISGISQELVPEPSSSMLFGLAGLALLIRRRR